MIGGNDHGKGDDRMDEDEHRHTTGEVAWAWSVVGTLDMDTDGNSAGHGRQLGPNGGVEEPVGDQ